MLVRVPYDRTAERVAALLAQKMETLPDALRNSATWDQGKEALLTFLWVPVHDR